MWKVCCVFFFEAGFSSKNNVLPSRKQILKINSETGDEGEFI